MNRSILSAAAVRRLGRLALLALMLAAPAQAATAQEAADDPEAAQEFIRSLSEQALAIWQDPTITAGEREDRFKTLLRDGFAIDFIARLVLGRHARAASRQQLTDYMALFPDYTVSKFSSRLGDYNDQAFHISGTAPAGEKDIFVQTLLSRQGGDAIDADWRIRRIDGQLQVVDVKVEGVSMAITQRDEFAAIIARKGFDGLLATLRADAEGETASAAKM